MNQNADEKNEINSIIDYALNESGIRRKLLWEELRCSLLKTARTTVSNFKSIPGINWIAMLAEKPLESAVYRAEWRKDTYKNKWSVQLRQIMRDKLNQQYNSRSSEELKSSQSLQTMKYIDEITTNAVESIYQKARNTSNKITIGVTGALTALAAVQNPWVLPISAVVTGGCVAQLRRINKNQIKINVAKSSAHISKQGLVQEQEQQTLDCSPRYSIIKGFENAMNKKLANVSNDEILANNDKQDAFRQVGNKNTNTQGMWGTAAIVAPLATTYIGSGYDFGAMTGTGVIAAASCGAITSMATTAVNNYIISKIKAQESLNMCCNLLKKFKSRDNSYERGNSRVKSNDNTIFISKDMCYQHKNYKEQGAPLLGVNQFKNSCDLYIGKGVTILGGASGAGKTTLTSLLRQGSYATQGSIQLGHIENGKFQGTDYKEIGNIEDNVGMAFQSAPQADNLSVKEYIMLENPEASAEKVKEVKKLLGIGKTGASGIIVEDAAVSKKLSGGQQKRIELARLLIKDSPVMILDEPTSGVDETMSDKIVQHLKELGKEKTIIYITHDAREIEKIGAYQAIDIDKKHDKSNSENLIKRFDLTNEDSKKAYVKFFENRNKSQTAKKQQFENSNNENDQPVQKAEPTQTEQNIAKLNKLRNIVSHTDKKTEPVPANKTSDTVTKQISIKHQKQFAGKEI